MRLPVSNEGRFYDRFDAVVLLSALTNVLLRRLETRTTNPYGKTAAQRKLVLRRSGPGVSQMSTVSPVESCRLAFPTRSVGWRLARHGVDTGPRRRAVAQLPAGKPSRGASADPAVDHPVDLTRGGILAALPFPGEHGLEDSSGRRTGCLVGEDRELRSRAFQGAAMPEVQNAGSGGSRCGPALDAPARMTCSVENRRRETSGEALEISGGLRRRRPGRA